MKKSLILMAAALAILVLVLAVRHHRERALYDDGRALDPRWKDEVVALRVAQGADSAAFLKLSSGWVAASDSFPLSKGRIEEALGLLFALRKKEVATEAADSAELQEYGFARSEVKTLEWTLASGKTGRVEIGGIADKEYESVFWKWPGAPEVYRTPGDFQGVPPRASEWKDRAVFPDFVYENVDDVEVGWRDSTGLRHHYKLHRISDTAVRMVEPDSLPILRRVAGEIYVQTPQFAADDFVEPGDPNTANAEVDSGWVTVRITMKDGTVHAIEGGKTVGEYRYARHPAHGRLIKVYKWRFAFFRKTVQELLHPKRVRPDGPLKN